MLELVIPETEQYDEANDRFITTKKQVLRLEHSLVSLSKWESKWHKPYLSRKPKTREEQIDYVRCMTLTQNVDPDVYTAITPQMPRKFPMSRNARRSRDKGSYSRGTA